MTPATRNKVVWLGIGLLFAGTLLAATCHGRRRERFEPPSLKPAPEGLHRLLIGDEEIHVELAVTPEERERGLMHRDSLGWDRGMLFVFQEEQTMSFWMKNTLIPLSIAFIGSDGVIAEILDMEPLTVRTYDSREPGRFALEVNQGWFAQHGVKPGDRVEGIPGRSPPPEDQD